MISSQNFFVASFKQTHTLFRVQPYIESEPLPNQMDSFCLLSPSNNKGQLLNFVRTPKNRRSLKR